MQSTFLANTAETAKLYPMEILENMEQWEKTFQENWLAHYQATGETKFSVYKHPRNEQVPGAPGVNLAQSRLMLVSTAGGYIPGQQEPFDAPNLLGDYTNRTFPSSIDLNKLAFEHDHYDHTMIDQDPQIALPLTLLHQMVADGRIADLTPSIVSISGYHPNAARVVREVVPQIVARAREEAAQAALLAPLWPLCHQSVGLIARALEIEGIATVIIAWNAGRARLVNVPRMVCTRFPRGTVFGRPHDTDQHLRILSTALNLLEQDAPITPFVTGETVEDE